MSTETTGQGARRRAAVLVAMTVANAMVLVDQTAVPLTLPQIMRHFDVGSQLVQWVLSASLLSLAAFVVLGGSSVISWAADGSSLSGRSYSPPLRPVLGYRRPSGC